MPLLFYCYVPFDILWAKIFLHFYFHSSAFVPMTFSVVVAVVGRIITEQSLMHSLISVNAANEFYAKAFEIHWTSMFTMLGVEC